MRISENMKTFNLLSDLNRTMERMMDTQANLSDSKRIHKPSDDPSGVARLIRLKEYQSRLERYQRNVEDASFWVTSAENFIADSIDIISNTDGILLQAGNDTLGEFERETLASQVQTLWEKAVQIANQKYGDKYLLGGTNNSTPPYEISSAIEDETFTSVMDQAVNLDHVGLSSGTVLVTSTDGAITYTENTDYTVDYEDGTITVLNSGTMTDATNYLVSYETSQVSVATINPEGVNGAIYREIDDNITMQINISLESIYESDDGLLNVLKDAINALERNDRDSFDDIRDRLDELLNLTTKMQGELGSKYARLDMQSDKLDTDILNGKKLISGIEDADITEAILQLENDQVVYQAALKTGAQLISVSLLNYL